MVFYTASRYPGGEGAANPEIGAAFKDGLTEPGRWSIYMMMQGETIPKEANHVRLSKDQKDDWGIPQLITSVDYDANDEKVLKEGRCNKHIGNNIDEVIQLLSNGTEDYSCQQIFQQVIIKHPSFRSGIGFYTFIELCNKIFNINPRLLIGIIDVIWKSTNPWPFHIIEQLLETTLTDRYNFRSDKIYHYIFHQTELDVEKKIRWLEHYKISFPATIFVYAITGISYDHDSKLFTWIMSKIQSNDTDYINVKDYFNKNFYDWYLHRHGRILTHVETMMSYYENAKNYLETYKPAEVIEPELIQQVERFKEHDEHPVQIDINRFSLLMGINNE